MIFTTGFRHYQRNDHKSDDDILPALLHLHGNKLWQITVTLATHMRDVSSVYLDQKTFTTIAIAPTGHRVMLYFRSNDDSEHAEIAGSCSVTVNYFKVVDMEIRRNALPKLVVQNFSRQFIARIAM
ncbi:hypothetical protein M8J75_001388 [Diaphorina citri]|nr:hypothetical protein M8J75_001388 [Diaphorina citri]